MGKRINTTYTSLHNHSEYSNLKLIDSINRTSRMIPYAYELGLTGLALTDHDCVSGHYDAITQYNDFVTKKYKEINQTEEVPSIEVMAEELNFKLILGNEIYLTKEGLNSENCSGEKYYHFILLAKDLEGHKQLRQLSSRAWGRSFMKTIMRTPTYPSDLFDIVKGGHLIASTACLGGFCAVMFNYYKQAPLQTQSAIGIENKEYYFNKIDNHLKMLNDLFGKENFFIELQPSLTNDQIEYNTFMIDNFWDKYNFIFTTDSHYMKKEERGVHRAFLNSKSSKDREVDEFYASAYMMSADEVYEYFKSYIDKEKFNIMVENTNKIQKMCGLYTLNREKVVTKVPYISIVDEREVFNEVTTEEYPYFYNFLHSENETNLYLAKLVSKGFVERYETKWDTNKYLNRLEEEFKTLYLVSESLGQNISDYFISMARMIDIMWEEADSIVGPSRGSAGALLINYLIGITQMNPIEQGIDLPVWRFIHPSRPDLPD